MDYKLSRSSTSSHTRKMTAASGRRTVKPRINRKRYGALLADMLPRVIETPEELERLAREIEPLLDKGDARTVEEEEVCRLVLKLIDGYQHGRCLRLLLFERSPFVSQLRTSPRARDVRLELRRCRFLPL